MIVHWLEWLECWYRAYFYGLFILLDNPGGFAELEFMRYFTYVFLSFIVFRLLFHSAVLFRLKRNFSVYSESEYPLVWKLYREAAEAVGLKKLPALYKFKNCKPMVFTAGTIKPSVFLAPRLTELLTASEMKAVLMHELVHVKRRDNLHLLIFDSFLMVASALFLQVYSFRFVTNSELAVAAVFVILMILFLFRKFLWKFVIDSLELSCDELCVKTLGDPLLLAGSLVKVWKTGRHLPLYRWKYSFAANGFLFFGTALERRLNRLVYYKKSLIRPIIRHFSLIMFLTVLISIGISAYHFHSTTTNIRWEDRGHVGMAFPHFCCNECLSWHKHNSK